ncbi:agamous-like MADS-box protein AGL62 [Solanum dulcamara]|uniref:agamous-like MADS-box protein AGL62 n=1 Tax=Solanum dulcamara TaxID=45834 RepID=UPI0024853536|nr:agamous-like MADS-box protein AGL62 [Solanum dulcamara]
MEDKKIAEDPKISGMKIENEVDQDGMFSKLRSDFYKKASKLVRECDIDVGIVLFPPSGDSSSFFHPTADAIIGRLMNPTIEFNADDVTKYEAWLDSASFKMKYILELLENEATSSSPSQ